MSEEKTIYRTWEPHPTLEQKRARYKPGYVYVIRAKGTTGVYKIGESIDAINRQVAQQKKHDYEIELLYHVEVKDKWQIEQAIHLKYHRYRLAGEWFALPREILESLPGLIKELDSAL